MRRAPLAVAIAAAVAGCGLPPESARVRVVGVSPEGDGVEPTATPTIDFSGAVDPGGLLDGTRALLVRADDLGQALSAVESEAGAGAGVARVACEASLEAQASRLVLSPLVPLPVGGAFALVLSSRARSSDGREVLDEEGKVRPTVVRFATLQPPPPAVLLTEVLADAATPEAGGEYAEVLNLGPGPLDLSGWRFEKRSAAGSWSGCTVGEGVGGPAAEGEVALLVGGSWDGRYGVPDGAAIFPCGATSLAGGIANDRGPAIRLLDRSGAVATVLDASALGLCAGALEVEGASSGAEATSCCACTEGSPGWLP